VNFRLKLGLITAEEAANSPGKNVITRPWDTRTTSRSTPSSWKFSLVIGSMLCSDGCTANLPRQ